MKILLTTLNSKFTHSSLALRDIQAYLSVQGIETTLVEYTINSNVFQVVGDLYRQKPDVIALSTYIWNVKEMVYIATQLKKVLPQVIVIFGGPEVSYDVEAFLATNACADYVIQGEGEWTMAELLKGLMDHGDSLYKWESLREIPGLAFLREGTVHYKPQVSQLPALDNIPFPYKTFEGLDHRILYYESSRGCPFSCTYCLSSATSGVRFLSRDRWTSDLKVFLEAGVMQVKFIDRTFNANPDRALDIWKFIQAHDNGVTNFHFEITAPLLRPLDIAFLKTLRPGLVQFEIGVQTTSKETGLAINRPIPFEDLKQVVVPLLESGNIHIHLDLIAGLPYETFNRFLQSIDDVFALRPHMLQLGFLKIIKGSKLEATSQQYEYVYEDQPPYEILANRFLSYEDLLRLKDIEEVIDHYYNSKHFPKSLWFILERASSPSAGLLAFADWLRAAGAFDVPNKTETWANYLLTYGESLKEGHPLLRDLLIVEWMAATGKVPPESIGYDEDVKSEVFEWLKSDDFASRLPQYSEVQPKEMIKKLRFSAIQYKVEKIVYNETTNLSESLRSPSRSLAIVIVDHRHAVNETYQVIVI